MIAIKSMFGALTYIPLNIQHNCDDSAFFPKYSQHMTINLQIEGILNGFVKIIEIFKQLVFFLTVFLV